MVERFEILEHAADVGFRAFGRSLPELFENAALAVESIAMDIAGVEPRSDYPLSAAGEDRESRDGILEEIPDAYKDVDEVIEVVHQAGLARKVARLRASATSAEVLDQHQWR